jgi:curved DNA-binding protein CbpA
LTLYEVLNLSTGCSAAEIEAAYAKRRALTEGAWRHLVDRLHLKADVDYAYFVLSDAERRRKYDSSPESFRQYYQIPIVI